MPIVLAARSVTRPGRGRASPSSAPPRRERLPGAIRSQDDQPRAPQRPQRRGALTGLDADGRRHVGDIVSGIMATGRDSGHTMPASPASPHANAIRSAAGPIRAPAAAVRTSSRTSRSRSSRAPPARCACRRSIRSWQRRGWERCRAVAPRSACRPYGVLTYTLSQRTKEIGTAWRSGDAGASRD